ncbi:MAG: putative O-methyltransferase YrrM [Oceanicoccus sp.]|jgi:predicted O-methyltransferase YrrM
MLKEILAKIEEEDAQERVWIVGPEVGRLLHWLVRVHAPETIVEIGTSVGYSALWMASALKKNGKGHLWTIESHAARFARAAANIEEAEVKEWITQIKHHAPEVFHDPEAELPEQIDLAFFDATKMEHQSYFDAVRLRMKSGGMIIVDNVQSHDGAFGGFIEFMKSSDTMETVIVSVGTGVLLARLV